MYFKRSRRAMANYVTAVTAEACREIFDCAYPSISTIATRLGKQLGKEEKIYYNYLHSFDSLAPSLSPTPMLWIRFLNGWKLFHFRYLIIIWSNSGSVLYCSNQYCKIPLPNSFKHQMPIIYLDARWGGYCILQKRYYTKCHVKFRICCFAMLQLWTRE